MVQLLKQKIKKHWQDKDFWKENADKLYEDFKSKFGIEKIKSFTPEECRDKLFGNKEDDSLVYNLERQYLYFAKLTGYKTIYVLYNKKGENAGWRIYQNGKSNLISESEATRKATEYRDSFVRFFEYIETLIRDPNWFNKESFEKIGKQAENILSELYGRNGKNWIWKYCHMLFPDIFTTFYSRWWINKIFNVLGIKPDNSYVLVCYEYARILKELREELKDLNLKTVYLTQILAKIDDLNIKESVEEDENDKEDEDDKNDIDIWKESRNIILYGPPGTGKTFHARVYALSIVKNRSLSSFSKKSDDEIKKDYNNLVKEGKIVFTTFHQNYGYEDFIQGLRPTKNETGQTEFKPVDGIFKQIVDKACKDKKSNYVIIIDEINRANISKVFGELITLIEKDKRIGGKNEITVKLPSGTDFAIPDNVYIVGTMNTADKSISMIDVALRRRFEFIEQGVALDQISDDTLTDLLSAINNKLVEDLKSTDLLIGHAYFMGKNKSELKHIMNNKIIPLLYEYYFDDREKVENVVKDAISGLDEYELDKDKTKRVRINKIKTDNN